MEGLLSTGPNPSSIITPSLPNPKTYEAEILREGSPPPTCPVSGVTFHVSNATCQMSHVMCHMSHVTWHSYFFFAKGFFVEGLLSTVPTPSRWEGPDLIYYFAILGESPNPQGGGLTEDGDFMSPTPKCDMFLESFCQDLSHSAKLSLTRPNMINLTKLG